MRDSLMDLVVAYLRDNGFEVDCSGEIKGSSGVKWRADCVFSKNFGIFKVTGIIVRSKGGNSNVMGTLEHAYTIKTDTGVDKVIIIYDEQAVSREVKELAYKLGMVIIDVNDYNRLQRSVETGTTYVQVDEFYIGPRISAKEVAEHEANNKGIMGVIGQKKTRILGVILVYLPLYCAKASIHSMDSREISYTEYSLCFEGSTGSLVAIDDEGGIYVVMEWQQLGELDPQALEVLKFISEIGTISMAQLKEHFYGSIDVESALEVLVEYGLIEETGGLFMLKEPPIEHYLSPLEEFEAKGLVNRGKPKCGRVLKLTVDFKILREIVESYGTIEKEGILYYPLYLVVVEKEKGRHRVSKVRIIDGLTGERLRDLEELIIDSRMADEINEIVLEVEKKPGVIEECGVGTGSATS